MSKPPPSAERMSEEEFERHDARFCVVAEARRAREVEAALAERVRVLTEYVRREEGTYNSLNGHFLCTDCYIKAGQPSSPNGWVRP